MEECSEDDFGQWATDEITGTQSYIDDENHVSGRGTIMSMYGSPDRPKVGR